MTSPFRVAFVTVFAALLVPAFNAIAGHTTAPAASVDPDSPVPETSRQKLACRFLYLCADDFVVDIYVNGKPIGDDRRKLLQEVFGATAERVDVELHVNDWIVFNVVNDRMRWKGSRYFAVAGMLAEGQPTFWSDADNGKWVSCETPGAVSQFISTADDSSSNHVARIDTHKWRDGDKIMQKLTGAWNGDAIWGTGKSRNIWVKYKVADPRLPEPKVADSKVPDSKGETPAPTPAPAKKLFDVP